MEGIQKIEVNNLMLKIDKNYDFSKLNLEEWEDYLRCLCQDRIYQREAIKTALLYLLSGKYSSINQLAKENFDANIELKEKYDCNFSKLEKNCHYHKCYLQQSIWRQQQEKVSSFMLWRIYGYV